MMVSKAHSPARPLEIDLTGPQGNPFFLLGLARSWASQLGKDPSAICQEMMAGDYDHLVAVFDREYGTLVTLYR